MENKALVDALVQSNLISASIGKKILQEAALVRRPVEELLYERRIVVEENIAKTKSVLLNVPFREIDPEAIPEDLLKIFPEELVRNYKVIPISAQKDLFIVGMLHPDDSVAQESLKFFAKQKRVNIGIYLVTSTAWEAILRRYSPYRSMLDEAVKSLNLQSGKGGSGNIVQLEEKSGNIEEAPIIKIVSNTLKEAVWTKASDIHIEPQRNRLRIRFRLDGDLQEVASLPIDLHPLILSRVKILANLKIDETRLPQDGRFRTVLFGRDIDYRVATFPTPVGEKAAIRVLDPLVGIKGLEALGLEDQSFKKLRTSIEKPYGMILITGPTGSGKTTTLYAIMQILNKDDINIVSLEDPVEYFMDGLNQSQVKPEIGYDFASGLRQILRQDPDVIMVGEIRDEETAGLAVHAALTGHIVLSTLHTNNSIGVVPRLVDMKVQPFLIPAAVNLMIAQRLVSKLCDVCKEAREVPTDFVTVIEKELIKLPENVKTGIKTSAPFITYHAKGCDACKGKGVVGRIAIFEMLEMTPEMERVISKGSSEPEIIEEAHRQKMITLRQDGILKALKGMVSLEDVLRETVEM